MEIRRVSTTAMKWVALATLLAASVLRQPAPEVVTRSGRLRGRLAENGRFYEYLGIPYATVDDRNRFQAPLPPPIWDGVFDAQNENTWCPQAALVSSIVLGQPDCLKLNIYVPVHASDAPFPVMVFIHGGCFFGGTGSPFLYGGDYFAEHGVIFVGINYRLSVEGFLCLGIKEAPGNAGLKDQLAALRWIRDNIHAFGGNKDDITLFGESAGAVSVSFMLLSESAKGLFHKAILQSGSSLSPWAMQHDPIATSSSLVKKLGYNSTNPREIYKILSQRTAQQLVSVLKYNEDKFCVADEHIFVPCVEKEIRGVDPIITQHPAKTIEAGNFTKMPMIIGHTDKEGIYFVASDYGTSLCKDTEKIDLLKTLQPDLKFPSELEKNDTIQKIKRHYFSSYQDEMIMNMVDLYSDVHFKVPLLLEAEMYSKRTDQPMYYYLFRYSGLINMPKIVSGFWRGGGASHADEMFYMFKPHAFPLPRFWENDMVKRMVMLWTNFAKFGDPTPKATPLLPFRWRPSREANPKALVIDSHPTTAPLWDKRSLTLWNDTYNRYRRKDYGFKKDFMKFTKSMGFGKVN